MVVAIGVRSDMRASDVSDDAHRVLHSQCRTTHSISSIDLTTWLDVVVATYQQRAPGNVPIPCDSAGDTWLAIPWLWLGGHDLLGVMSDMTSRSE